MANERLYQFPSKASPTPSDIIYCGNAADGFNEVNITIAGLISAYPNLSGIAALSLSANTFTYSNNSAVLVTGTITSFGVSALAITSANNSFLITNASGVAILATTLPTFTMNGNIAMGTNSITGLANPVNAQDAVTKNYVDNIATGGGAPVACATTAALTVTQSGAGVGATLTNATTQAAFSVDGVTPAVGARVLVKNQASPAQNGVYTLTAAGSGASNWVLTRAADYDTVVDINNTGNIPVSAGTLNINTGWINTTLMVTVDTTAITYINSFGGNISANSIAFTSTSGIIGTTTNNNAAAGSVGEIISSVVLNASSISLSTNTAKDLTSISLTAGDYDIYGTVYINSSGVLLTVSYGWCSLTSATTPDPSRLSGLGAGGGFNTIAVTTGYLRISIATTTTVYISALAVFASGTTTMCGGIYARRVR